MLHFGPHPQCVCTLASVRWGLTLLNHRSCQNVASDVCREQDRSRDSFAVDAQLRRCGNFEYFEGIGRRWSSVPAVALFGRLGAGWLAEREREREREQSKHGVSAACFAVVDCGARYPCDWSDQVGTIRNIPLYRYR